MLEVGPPIVAIASPPGRSARGVVRMSGTGTHAALAQLTDHRPIESVTTEAVGAIAPVHLALSLGLLPALAIRRAAGASYTGEESVDVLLPGNPLLLSTVADALIAASESRGVPARYAEPGEFTARALLLGRIDLPRAEAVAVAVAARNDDDLRAARLLADGRLGRAAAEWTDGAMELLALVEAGIDFTDEEDVRAIESSELALRSSALADSICAALSTAVRLDRLESLPTVVLAGPPNAGKSTLFNALVNAQRVVTSSIAGTTRDAVTEEVEFRGTRGAVRVTLVDVAGEMTEPSRTADGEIASTHPLSARPLDLLGQRAAGHARDRADLVIQCVPPDVVMPTAFTRNSGAQLIVWTKGDLRDAASVAQARREADHVTMLVVSAATRSGLDALGRAIADALQRDGIPLAGSALAVSMRHDRCLRDAADLLLGVAHRAELDGESVGSPELSAADLRAALDALGRVTGRVMADDVLGAIFSRFCIGK